jgi:hypothetical protein
VVAADDLALIQMDDYVVDGRAVRVVLLHAACVRVLDLDGGVLGARHHLLVTGLAEPPSHGDCLHLSGESSIKPTLAARHSCFQVPSSSHPSSSELPAKLVQFSDNSNLSR